MNHEIDHALPTINRTLDGMDSVLQMMMDVESANKDAIGYLMLNCTSDIRKHCAVTEAEINVDPPEKVSSAHMIGDF